MKKILSLLLVFVLSLTLVGALNDVQAADGDATVYFHINQFDGDYTNTGIGIWDGIAWNGWGALANETTDAFGAVVEWIVPAANFEGMMDDVQLEITKTINGADDAAKQAGLIAPGDGKVFVDMTSIKDGSKTELHVYYVEGAEDTYIPKDNMGVIAITYIDPKAAADAEVYDAWDMWTFNNGTGGSEAGPAADEGFKFAMDMTVEGVIGDVTYEMPMKLAYIEVAADADLKTGFIVRTEDWVKQCATDIEIDNTSVRGSGALLYYYQADSCTLETDGAAYLTDITAKFEMNAGNRFLEGTMVTDPTTVEIELLMPKNPAAYDMSRFKLLDADGVMIPIDTLTVPGTEDLGVFLSEVTCTADEYYFVLFVDTDLDHSKLGVVGDVQGWTIGSPITTLGIDTNGNAVFEACSANAAGGFKLLYDADGTFEWGGNTVEVTPANQSFDMEDGMAGIYYIKVESVIAEDVVPTVNLVGEIEKYVKVYVDSTHPVDYVGLVGSHNGWTVSTPTMATETDEFGYYVYEFVTDSAAPEFKVYYDDEEDGTFDWSPEDVELTGQVVVDLSAVDEITYFVDQAGNVSIVPMGTSKTEVDPADYTYTAGAACLAGEEKLTLFVNTAYDHSKLSVVGGFGGAIDWQIATVIPSIGDDANGLAVFEICAVEDAASNFKVVYDEDGTFEWSSPTIQLTPADQPFDLTTDDAYYLEGTDMTVGSFTPALTPVSTVLRLIRIYVDTDKDHAKIGLVGTFNDWDITAPIMMTKDETNGLAYFELSVEVADIDFKLVFDEDGVSDWNDAGTEQLTPENQIFEIGSSNEIALYIKDGVAREFNMDLQFFPADQMKLDTVMLTATVDSADALMFGEEYTIEYLDSYATDVDPDEWVASNVLVIGISESFEPAKPVEGMGTYAVLPTVIQVVFGSAIEPMTNLMLKDSDGTVIPMETYVTGYEIPEYEATRLCPLGDVLFFVHFNLTDTMIDDMDMIGIVGTINGWDAVGSVEPRGMDSAGQYVFEVCVAADSTEEQFKILYDEDMNGFSWDDKGISGGDNIVVNPSMGLHVYVEEGTSSYNLSKTHMITLTEANKLDITKEYHLEFVDENGFTVYIPVDLDDEAPVIDFAIIPNTDFVVDNAEAFDLMNIYTKIQFLDNREGEMAYEFVTNIDLDTLGAQTLTIKAVDSWMNETTYDIMVTVVDTTPPTITGDMIAIFDEGAEEPDWSSYVTVSDDGTLSINDSQVDMDNDGSFFVIFTAVDSEGNSASHTLEVTIEAAEVVNTGCGSAIQAGSLIALAVAILGGAVLFFVRKP